MADLVYVSSVKWQGRANIGDSVQIEANVENIEGDESYSVEFTVYEYSGTPGGGFTREEITQLSGTASAKDPVARAVWVVSAENEPSERGGPPEFQVVAHLPERNGPSSTLLKLGEFTGCRWVPPEGTPQPSDGKRVDFVGGEKVGLRAEVEDLVGFSAQFRLIARKRDGRRVVKSELHTLPPVEFKGGVATTEVSLEDIPGGPEHMGGELEFEVDLMYGGIAYKPKCSSGIARNRLILELTEALSGAKLLPVEVAEGATVPAPIAWISPHGSSGEPAMPRLEARLQKVTSKITVGWKFKAVFHRPRVAVPLEMDTAIVPADGGYEGVPGPELWRPWHTWLSWPEEEQYFGGECTITFRIGEGVETVQALRILGRNPSNDEAKRAINAETRLWYYYAICKHETGGFGDAGEHYVQFRRPGSAGPRSRTAGTPVWGNADAAGPGGAGMTQITGLNGDGATHVPRLYLWNWAANVRHGAVIMEGKAAGAAIFTASQRNQMQIERISAGLPELPPPVVTYGVVTFEDGTRATIEDANAIRRYNGGTFCYWDNPNGRWVVNPFAVVHLSNGRTENIHYVQRVCNDVEEAPGPPIVD